MKRITVLFAAFFGAVVITFGQTDYKMWEVTYMKPTTDNVDLLMDNLAAHIKKFHTTGPRKISVWSNMTGSHIADLAWVMGPFTFTDMDTPFPDQKAHDDDWNKNVEPYLDVTASDYWKLDEKLSYVPENYKYGGKVIWSIFDLQPFEAYRFKELCKKIIEVYNKKTYTHTFEVYWNQFESKEGRDVVIETNFSKWAFLDEDDQFVKDYEEINGEGSYRLALEEYRDIVISVEDEVSEIIPELSPE
jgi:hypothetical protein